jgi:hypothetical protein
MLGDLLLLSGNDIPFPGARVTIHQPSLKEIAYIGEEMFFIGCGFLNFSKDLLAPQDKVRLSNYHDFDIFMSIMTDKQKETKRSQQAAFLVLTLIFPLYEVSVRDKLIVLKQEDQEFYLNKDNFSEFRSIIVDMFNLNLGDAASDEYNPSGDMASRIAEKFRKRHEQLNKIAKEQFSGKRFAILSRYASILAIGLQISLTDIMQWTVYQLYDEFQRFQLKVQWDAYIQARMAGAKDLEEVDNWMIDLREQGKAKNKSKNKK